MDAATSGWVDSITGFQLAEMASNNPSLFGRYMQAVEPEYRRLRTLARQNPRRVGDSKVQRVGDLNATHVSHLRGWRSENVFTRPGAMNQRDATVAIIEFVRLHAPDDKSVLRALKVLERRAEVLRLRHERRNVSIPEDLFDEPTSAFTGVEILADLRGIVCRPCGRKKRAGQSLCVGCFDALEPGVRKALWSQLHYGHAYHRAVRQLLEARAIP
jgi:hypothetical protein